MNGKLHEECQDVSTAGKAVNLTWVQFHHIGSALPQFHRALDSEMLKLANRFVKFLTSSTRISN